MDKMTIRRAGHAIHNALASIHYRKDDLELLQAMADRMAHQQRQGDDAAMITIIRQLNFTGACMVRAGSQLLTESKRIEVMMNGTKAVSKRSGE